jgi:L-aspartate oxidase
LRNNRSEDFMKRYDARGTLAPRDIVARAIDAEVKRSGAKCVFLDITHKSPEFIRERFQHIYETCLRFGIDMPKQPIPVVPAAHYQCGGLKQIQMVTSLGGVVCDWRVVHRIAGQIGGSSLRRPGNGASSRQPLPALTGFKQEILYRNGNGNVQDVDELVVIYHNWDEIRRWMWDYVGIVPRKRLQRASARLRNLQREIHEFYWNFKVSVDLLELRNLATVAALIVDSALSRNESRGLHYTLDYPEPKDRQFRHETVLSRG